jgi:hypothetical protein
MKATLLDAAGGNMRTKFLALLFWLAFGLAAGAASSVKADIIDSINAQYDPSLAASWNVPEVGWVYIPTFSYTLSGIGTKFGSSDGRTVTAEIFSGAPGSLSLLGAGNLLTQISR